jgi:16S rRNA processing protein RimM
MPQSGTSTQSGKFVRVGKMKDAHGIRGELFVVLFASEAYWLKSLKDLRLVKEDGSAEPKIFEVKSARAHKNGLIVKTEGIKDRNEAEALKGLLVEIPEEFLVSKPGEAIFLREILGFNVSTVAQGEIGPIIGFSSNVAQDLLVVKTVKGEFEIPYVKPFVKKVDYKSKTILLDLPLGLLGEELDPALSVRDGQTDHLADAHEASQVELLEEAVDEA